MYVYISIYICKSYNIKEKFKEWRKKATPARSLYNMGFPGGSDCKESAYNVGDLGSIPGWVRSHAGGHGNPLQYSCLENLRGQRSMASYSPWGHKESNTTKQLSTAHVYNIYLYILCINIYIYIYI